MRLAGMHEADTVEEAAVGSRADGRWKFRAKCALSREAAVYRPS